MIQKLGRGIAYTSANLHTKPKPATFEHVHPEIKEKVDYVAHVPQKEMQKLTLSTIMRLELNGQIKFYRK